MPHDQPYSNTFHPYKSWLDKLLYIVAFRKCNEIVALPWAYWDNDDDSNKILKDGIHEYRVNMSKGEQGMIDGIFKKNLKGYEKNTVQIPRNDDILKTDYDIQMNEMPKFQIINEESDGVTVSILCPRTLQEQVFPKKNEKDSPFTFLEVDPSIPIIIYFHGGGFVMGGSLDFYSVSMFDKLLSTTTTKQGRHRDAIFVSVEYRLAPERPFPCGLIDCLSVMEYVCSCKCSPITRKFHLAGASAGGNFCTVVTMEHLRRFKDHRISSVFIDIPFLDPNANSLSYYKNSKSSIVPFLSWCFRSYISSKLTGNDDDDKDFTNNTTHAQESLWMKDDNIARLIYPTKSVPPAKNDADIVKFIVVTSLADPLHDDGVALVNKLEEMGHTELKHFETMSDHATYPFCDRSMAKKICSSWSSTVFETTV